MINLGSYPESLTYKLPLGTRQGAFRWGFAIEREFGMRVERVGGRWYCRWSAVDLRLFILEHVTIGRPANMGGDAHAPAPFE